MPSEYRRSDVLQRLFEQSVSESFTDKVPSRTIGRYLDAEEGCPGHQGDKSEPDHDSMILEFQMAVSSETHYYATLYESGPRARDSRIQSNISWILKEKMQLRGP